MKNLTEFISVFNSKTIPESEMNNFIREYERTEIKKIPFNKDLDAIKEYIRKTVE